MDGTLLQIWQRMSVLYARSMVVCVHRGRETGTRFCCFLAGLSELGEVCAAFFVKAGREIVLPGTATDNDGVTAAGLMFESREKMQNVLWLPK